jgi:NitT/TauT family transport system substrate-binding protein
LVPATAAALALAFGAGGAAAQQPVKIRIAWVVPIGNWASIIYEKKDLMTHYGKSYVVEPVHFQSTPQMITALAAGELEIADLAYSSFAIAVENAGMSDLKIIADEAQDGAHGYYSGQYFVLKDGPIKTIEDLKGKVLATVGAGAAIDIPVRALLRQHGLEDKRDYTMIEAAFPNMPAMLEAKKVDFIPSVPPFSLAPALQQQGRVLFTVADALGGPTEFIIWAAHASFIQKNHAAMVDLFEDAERAVHFFLDPKNHDEVMKIAAKVSGAPAARLGYVFTKADDYHDPNMIPDLDTFQRGIDIQQKMGFLAKPLDAKKYADLSLVKEAAARIK